MKKVDLNVDIGEGFPHDEALLEFATSANVCCGEHAGSWDLTLATLDLCRQKRVRIGMHPGYPDRASLGRRSFGHKPEDPMVGMELMFGLMFQGARIGQVKDAAYVKPHGAFYNDTAVPIPTDFSAFADPRWSSGKPNELLDLWLASVPNLSDLERAVSFGPKALMGLRGTAHEALCQHERFRFISEGFADRRYREDGTLVPRSELGAVLENPEEIRAQVLRLAPEVDSICLHGDTLDCLVFAELVKKTLIDAGYEVGY